MSLPGEPEATFVQRIALAHFDAAEFADERRTEAMETVREARHGSLDQRRARQLVQHWEEVAGAHELWGDFLRCMAYADRIDDESEAA